MNPWEPIEQAIREVLAAKGQAMTDENVQNVCVVFVSHLMAGKDFRIGVEETIDYVLNVTADFGGLDGLIIA